MDRMRSMSNDQIIAHIIANRNNYYSILFVDKQTTSDQIKIHYKRLAVRCHPDKNHENKSANDAFKLLNTAHATLTDSTKRDIYNRNGTAGVQRHESGGGRPRPYPGGGGTFYRAHQHQQQFYGNDFFEEMFGFTRGGHARHRGPQRPGVRVEEYEIQPQLLLFLPLLLIVLLSLFMGSSSLFDEDSGNGLQRGSPSSESQFSLTPSPSEGFTVPRTTTLHGLNVRYFVSRRMNEILQRKKEVLVKVEEGVLRAQRNYLNTRCEAETYLHRSKRKKTVPKVCEEYQEFRKKVG